MAVGPGVGQAAMWMVNKVSKTLQMVSAIAVLIMLSAGFIPANAQLNEPLPGPMDDFVLNGGFEVNRGEAPLGDEICEAYGDDIWLPPQPLPALVILSCTLDENKPVHWSALEGTVFGDLDEDGDLEARLGPGHSHNLWQAYPSPHQTYSARMENYRFTLESSDLQTTDGDGREILQVPNNAAIRLSLATSPSESVHPFVVLYQECVLRWTGAQINDAIDADGNVVLDPLEAAFQSTYSACDDAATSWNDPETDDEAKLDLLGRLRIVQNSFWNFNSGGNTVIVDDIGTAGSTLTAQEVAAGNQNL